MMAGEFVAALEALGSELKSDRDTHFEPPYTTVQANMIAGGTAVNVLAREALVTWEYRGLPDRDAAAIVSRAREQAETQDPAKVSRACSRSPHRDHGACVLSGSCV